MPKRVITVFAYISDRCCPIIAISDLEFESLIREYCKNNFDRLLECAGSNEDLSKFVGKNVIARFEIEFDNESKGDFCIKTTILDVKLVSNIEEVEQWKKLHYMQSLQIWTILKWVNSAPFLK